MGRFLIAGLTCVTTFVAGVWYAGEEPQRIPCITNYADAWHSYNLQRMLNDDEEELQEDGSYRSRRADALEIIRIEQEGDVESSVHIRHDRFMYYVPSHCYVEETPFRTILWRK